MLLAPTLQKLFGSIILFQILAHMPIANIILPANSMQAFEIMASIVSFDYFPVFDHLDVGFTPTDSYRVNYEWLGYESLNFLEGLGSISVMIVLGIIFVIVITVLRVSKLIAISKPIQLFHKALTFVQGTFFEILLCASIGMKMFTMLEYLNEADKVAICCQMVCAFVLLSFVAFVFYFTLVEVPKIVVQN